MVRRGGRCWRWRFWPCAGGVAAGRGLRVCRRLDEGGVVAGRARQQAKPVSTALAEDLEQLVVGQELSLRQLLWLQDVCRDAQLQRRRDCVLCAWAAGLCQLGGSWRVSWR